MTTNENCSNRFIPDRRARDVRGYCGAASSSAASEASRLGRLKFPKAIPTKFSASATALIRDRRAHFGGIYLIEQPSFGRKTCIQRERLATQCDDQSQYERHPFDHHFQYLPSKAGGSAGVSAIAAPA
jgi:hypothetical protein